MVLQKIKESNIVLFSHLPQDLHTYPFLKAPIWHLLSIMLSLRAPGLE